MSSDSTMAALNVILREENGAENPTSLKSENNICLKLGMCLY